MSLKECYVNNFLKLANSLCEKAKINFAKLAKTLIVFSIAIRQLNYNAIPIIKNDLLCIVANLPKITRSVEVVFQIIVNENDVPTKNSSGQCEYNRELIHHC